MNLTNLGNQIKNGEEAFGAKRNGRHGSQGL